MPDERRRPTVGRLALAVGGALLVNLLLQLAIGAGSGRAPAPIELTIEAFSEPTLDDSWRPMTAAIRHLRDSPATPLYSQIFFRDSTKFQYPPSSLVIPDLAQRASGAAWSRVWWTFDALARTLLLVAGALGWMILRRGAASAREGEDGAPGGPDRAARVPALAGALVLVLAAITFAPLSKSVQLGQVQTFLTFLLMVSLLLWQAGRRTIAGALLGLCCAVKPHWGLLVLWFMLRRERGAAVACAASALALVAASVALYGAHHYMDYFSALAFISERGEAWYANQSFNGLLNRLLLTGSPHDWSATSFPEYNAVVHAGTIVTSVLLLIGAMVRARRHVPTALDLALVQLTLVIATPVAWEHHYGILFGILCLLLAHRTRIGATALTSGSLLLAYLLAANFQELPRSDRFTEAFAQSWLFLTGCVILLMLYQATRRTGISVRTSTR